MNNTNNIKILAFVIAFKRYKKNSVVFKEAKYKIASKFNLHPTTFSNYLSQAIEKGYIVECENSYSVVKFRDILSSFYCETKLYFSHYSILKSNTIDFKQILRDVEDKVVFDNSIRKQSYVLNKKKVIVTTVWLKGQTDIKAKISKNVLKRCSTYKSVEDAVAQLNYNSNIITSARNISSNLSFSVSKSNKILNRMTSIKRHINVLWFKGCNSFLFESLKAKYPKAVIIPCVKFNKIKVCFGSSIEIV